MITYFVGWLGATVITGAIVLIGSFILSTFLFPDTIILSALSSFTSTFGLIDLILPIATFITVIILYIKFLIGVMIYKLVLLVIPGK